MPFLSKAVTWVKDRTPAWNRHVPSNSRTDRPRRDERLSSIFDSETFLKIPPFPMSYTSMYAIHQMEIVSRTCVNNIKNETFRRGLRWKAKWTSKCPKCNKTYTGTKPLDRCPKCDPEPDTFYSLLGEVAIGEKDITDIEKKMLESSSPMTEMLQPDPNDYLLIDEFIKKCNSVGLSLIEVLKEMCKDWNVVDEGYMVIRKEYDYVNAYYDEFKNFIYANPKHEEMGLLPGTILRYNVLEVFRGSPKIMRKVIDQNNNIGGRWYKCIHCGQIVENGRWGQDAMTVNTLPRAEPDDRGRFFCQKDGFLMHDVIYFEMLTEYGDVRKFYIAGEVIHRHKFSTSTGYGEPAALSNYPYQACLIYGITYIRDFLEQRKVPQGIIQIVTANVTKAMKRWGDEARKRKEDKQHVPVMFVEPEATGLGGTGQVKWIPMMQTLADMQWTEARDECRQRITYFYGVSANFIADSKGSTGSNINDGKQLVVSNRTIETEQQIVQGILDELMPMLKVVNWRLCPVPTEDRDVAMEEDIETKKVQRMQMLYSMGFEVDTDANDNWVYWKPEISKEQQAMLKELMSEKLNLETQLKQYKESQTMQTYDSPKTELSGDPAKNKQDISNKGITKEQVIEPTKPCSVCENVTVGDWEFVMECFMKSIPIYSVEDDNGIIDLNKSVVRRGGKHCIVQGHTQKNGSEQDAPKGTAIRGYEDLEKAKAMHYAIRQSQKRRGEFAKEMPPDQWMMDSMTNTLGASQPLLHFIWNHWRGTEIEKAFQNGTIGEVQKADGAGDPKQMPKTTRAEGRTKTPADQTPKSGSGYTPGQTGQYTCKTCGQSFKSKEELGGHKEKCKGKPGNDQSSTEEEFNPGQIEASIAKIDLLMISLLNSLTSSHRPSNAVQKKNSGN